MKKIKSMALVGTVPLLLSSCIIMSHSITTGNPIGTKEGIVTSKLVGSSDAGIAAAVKKGNITKVGSVDVKLTSFGKLIVKVTGE